MKRHSKKEREATVATGGNAGADAASIVAVKAAPSSLEEHASRADHLADGKLLIGRKVTCGQPAVEGNEREVQDEALVSRRSSVATGSASQAGSDLAHSGQARQTVSAKRRSSLTAERGGSAATTTVPAESQTYFMPFQARWIRDQARLKIVEKSRQIGFSYCDSYDSVKKAAMKGGLDVWVMSRDEVQAKQYILYCKRWANVLNHAAQDFGEQVFSDVNGKPVKVQVLTFASGASIYALSSNPDAIVGKTGHVKLDEYAIHKAQRDLFTYSKPVIQWGGTLTIISTHRGVGTMFNKIIVDIKERGNPMGWSLHTVPIQKAVEEGLVEKIDKATGGALTAEYAKDAEKLVRDQRGLRQWWLAKQRAECIDEEQWLQEYCCIPADEASAFISYEMINGAEATGCLQDWAYLETCQNPLYVGLDVARKKDLCVFDIGERVGDVMWDRMRIELRGKKFSEIEYELNRIMGLAQVKRLCGDSTGMGMQLMERAVERWGYRCEAVTFTGQVKEDLAFGLRQAFEDSKLRIAVDDKLKGDLRGIKKEVTAVGNIRFVGDSEDSHCDRFWAKALRQHAVSKRSEFFSALI